LFAAVISVVIIFIAIVLFSVAATNLWWMLFAWRSPDDYQSTFYPTPESVMGHSFSIIVPARHETDPVLRATVESLVTQSYSKVEVILAVGHDDPETVEVAHRIAAIHPAVKVSINTAEVKNKPRQLNTALLECTGDVVGVFDAESLAAADLLEHVDQVFQTKKADVVQGAVQLINLRSRWFSLRNCLEYYFWFRSRLHLHARKQFIPLGGNTVFIRRELLEAVDGWDGNCLAEDCDLGVRLSSRGRRITVAFDPALVTREETPDTVYGLVKQRTRWNLGFIQVFHKGDWRSLPSRRVRNVARFTLLQPFAQAFSAVAIPIAVLTGLLGHFSLPVTFVTFAPLAPTFATLAFEVVGLREFGRDYGLKIKARDYVVLVVSLPIYQVLLSWAALRAVLRFFGRNFEWEKTAHSGAHLQPAPVDTTV
jgi:cellulose synthase/poly-beta-1,6-N-acetylglucosamine synthase-like glycosyltransferase